MAKSRTFIHTDNLGLIRLCVETRLGLSDFPIRYSDGQIAYDYPEHIPLSIKAQVLRRFNLAYKRNKPFHNDRFGR